MKRIYSVLLGLTLCGTALAQSTLHSQVRDRKGQPIAGAIVTVVGEKNAVVTDSAGYFTLKNADAKRLVSVKADGYDGQVIPVGILSVRQAIVLAVTGEDGDANSELLVTAKSGMPGEGKYLHIGGVHSLFAETTPLIVVNGVPYMTSQNTSGVFNGYSRDMLLGIDPKDIKTMRVLKGTDAAAWGSLGSNGVVEIETQQANSNTLETRMTFSGRYGFSMPGKTIPVLDATQYRSYMQDIGMTRYPSMTTLQRDYPFLTAEPGQYGYLFNENTDWMDLITRNGFHTENLFRVEGGDAISKYNISFGYNKDNGTLKGTSQDKYHALISADIVASRQVDIFTNVGLAYVKSHLQNQGMQTEVSPILSAYLASPLISPYSKDAMGGRLSTLATYDEWNVNDNPLYAYDNTSNPLSLVNDVNAQDKIYDANAQLGLNWRPNEYFRLTGLFNFFYNYAEETLFIPGVTRATVMPQLYGTCRNKVANSTLTQAVYTGQLEASYSRLFDGVHQMDASLRGRYMIRNNELDLSEGYNTAGDSYTTLENTNDGQLTTGDNTEWKYMGWNLHAGYTWSEAVGFTANLSIDRASVTGSEAAAWSFFPSVGARLMTTNMWRMPSWLNRLDVTAEAAMSGNSRFSSNYAKSYYVASRFLNMGSIVRSNVPNTKLAMERKRELDFGIDTQIFDGLLSLRTNWFTAENYDLLLIRDISEVYGSKTYYDNTGSITNSGIDLSLTVTPVNTRDWTVSLTGNVMFVKSRVKSLGGDSQIVTDYTGYGNDDAHTMLRVGEEPWQFYGLQTKGVYATTADAETAHLRNAKGDFYRAGDVAFVDQNGDGVIDDEDRVALGSNQPKMYGSIGVKVRFRQWSLLADFGFVTGNKLYNATRRQLSSMSTLHNQSTGVLNRWQVEGQQTTMPRADYGDPMGNNRFSDRWIEKGDYLKLRGVRLTYSFGKILNVIRSGEVYLSGENLFCLTRYLGGDPEFAYSYDESLRGFDYAKLTMPRSFEFGFNINF